MFERIVSATADVRDSLVAKALDMGTNTEILDRIEEVKLQKSVGTSVASAVKLGQVLRKVKDYLTIFPEENFEQVMQAETRLTLGHEYGHQLCRAADVPSSEKNAEFWGRAAARDNAEAEIMKRARAISVAKSHQVISAIKKARSQNIQAIMAMIAKEAAETFPLMSQLALARADLYGQNHAEDYASPTSEEEMTELINKTS